MDNIIIGTAGHIDHGKTTLVKAITGRETDRLKEEKERGISIELGFTYFDLPSGRRAGIVDVPGHEKFIKNMLAGVGGIDIVVLVVAADEGIMPQTQEHINILTLLEVKRGIIALTKCDMVEEEWIAMVTEDIKEAVSQTFLSTAPIIPVSSIKGIGINELVSTIDDLTEKVEERDIIKPFRLPIDRVFTITGFGTVVTGTLIEGSVREGEVVTLYPGDVEAKVRSIQVHDNKAEGAVAGQRVAINISNIKKNQVGRGDVLAAGGTLQPTMMLDCKIKILPDSPFPIRNRERVRIYHGTSEILGRIVLLDQEELLPGQEGFVQLRLEDKSVARPMDHFIIRFYSPMVTIGGGMVLDAHPPKRKRFMEEVLEELRLKEKGDSKEILLQFLKNHSRDYMTLGDIQNKTAITLGELKKDYELLLTERQIIQISIGADKYLFHMEFINDKMGQMKDYLEGFHKKFPLKAGIPKEEIRNKFFEEAKIKLTEELLRYIEEKGLIAMDQGKIALGNFTIRLSDSQRKISRSIEKEFKEKKLNPPRVEEVLQDKGKESKEYKQVFDALVEWEKIIKINEETYFHRESYNGAIEKLQEYFESNNEINVATFRDLLGTSRKFAITLLEYFDQNKITKRIGDTRILNR